MKYEEPMTDIAGDFGKVLWMIAGFSWAGLLMAWLT